MSDKPEHKKVSEEYPEVFHYTTAIGLEGIVSSQTLRATHYEYMNDSDEYQAFFKYQLKEIIKGAIRPVLQNTYQLQEKAKQRIDNSGGIENYLEDLIARGQLSEHIQEAIGGAFEPYIISFCGAHTNQDHVYRDGLLSQWRGYGTDGGYAIEFDTKEIEKLLGDETNKYHYAFSNFCDVNYCDSSTGVDIGFPEKVVFKEKLQNCIQTFFEQDNEAVLEQIFPLTWALASAQKHSGFAEEAEVRLVLIPATKQNIEKQQILSKSAPLKDYSFVNRNGVLVPYITLFQNAKLPLKRVIVGPHQDSKKRQKSAQMLLSKYSVNAEVTISNIPYIGK